MPAKFNLYSAWIDPYFYVWAAVFAGALFVMIYAIRRYLELKNAAPFGEEEQEPAPVENPFLEEPAPAPAAAEFADGDKTLVVPPPFQPELPAEEAAPAPEPAPQPEAAPVPAPAPRAAADQDDHSRAENFVRGIYAGITDLDERMKGIEDALSKSRVNSDFAVKFLEDMLQDIETLDKTKIRARIEYLISDLKK